MYLKVRVCKDFGGFHSITNHAHSLDLILIFQAAIGFCYSKTEAYIVVWKPPLQTLEPYSAVNTQPLLFDLLC